MRTLIDEYIEKQALKAEIQKFSDLHDSGQLDQKEKYQSLIPSSKPGPGQQYAFEVDLDKCTGCKACVTACHNENGLEEDETWRSVGLVQGGNNGNAAMQHITSACHHCVEPACLSGCPTQAYEKDKETGIVKHLDDQCFGCQYCILKCPYDVPKYSKKKGIVHKCDMCIGRLTADQAPACARSCPNGAIRIVLVDQKDAKEKSHEYVDVPDSPSSNYTYPTTKYKTEKHFPTNMESVDYYTLKPEHGHLPLVFMLVLTQLSVGAFGAQWYLQKFVNHQLFSTLSQFNILAALCLGLLALASSILHLGRPQYAFRAFLGFKTSWLSREIIAFGGFAKLAILYAACLWFEPLNHCVEKILGGVFIVGLPIMVCLAGMLGVSCSVMVYRDTRRPFWDNHYTTLKFFTTSIILGVGTILLSSMIYMLAYPSLYFVEMMNSFGKVFLHIMGTSLAAKLFLEVGIFIHLGRGNMSDLEKTAILMKGPLKREKILRLVCGAVGLVCIGLISSMNPQLEAGAMVFFMIILWLALLVGELLERFLFFKAVVPLKMPGGSLS